MLHAVRPAKSDHRPELQPVLQNQANLQVYRNIPLNYVITDKISLLFGGQVFVHLNYREPFTGGYCYKAYSAIWLLLVYQVCRFHLLISNHQLFCSVIGDQEVNDIQRHALRAFLF